MEILSFEFIFFILAALVVYYLLPQKLQNSFLLAASYYFYSTWDWKFVAYLTVITVFNFTFARLLHREKHKKSAPLWLGVVINIVAFGILVFQDFFGLQVGNFLRMLGTEGLTLRLLLPIGFSYYVLESISYLVDVKRKQLKATTDIIDFALYLAYFPKLISGPIERARSFLPQLREDRVVDNEIVARSIALILIGLLRTSVFADILIIIVPFSLFQDPLAQGNIDLVIWIFAYGLILYNQFAGYTDIVRGVSALFGIQLSANFSQPFFSQSFSDFWTRWHISLSQWLRDYVYLPLSRAFLRRNPSRRNIANILIPPMITMLVSGLWHGANLHLLVWAAVMGIYMIAEQILSLFQRVDPSRSKPAWRKIMSMGIVLSLALAAAIPFRLDLARSKVYLYGIIKADNWSIPNLWPLLFLAIPLVFDFLQYRASDELVVLKSPRWVQSLMVAGVIMAVFIVFNLQSSFLPFVYP